MQFDYEELMSEVLNISGEDRGDDKALTDAFHEKYQLDMDAVYPIVVDLLKHTPKVKSGLGGKSFHAFVSLSAPVMLMRVEATDLAEEDGS